MHYVEVPVASTAEAKLDPKQWTYEKIPMYKPHEVLAYLWDTVGVEVPSQVVSDFWSCAKANNIPWALLEDSSDRLPIKLFGDDCQYNDQMDKCIAIIISCPLFRPRSARNARWIVAVLKLSTSVGFESLRPVLAECVHSLNIAYDQATPRTGTKFVVTEVAGDWKYLRESFNMQTHWNSRLMCHHCRLPREDFPTYPDNLPFRTTADFISEVLRGPNVTPLILLRNFDVTKITWCQLHNINLGLLWTCNGGCMALLLELGAFGSLQDDGVKACLQRAYTDFKCWQKMFGTRASQRPFTIKMLFKAAHGAYLNAKGHNGRVLCAFLTDTAKKVFNDQHLPAPEELVLVTRAMFLDPVLPAHVCLLCVHSFRVQTIEKTLKFHSC